MAGGGSGGANHLIEILLKVFGSEEAKKKMAETGNAGEAMNQKISKSAKDAQKLYTAFAAASARVGSLIPTSMPFGQMLKDMTRLTSASLGTAGAMKNLNVSMGKVAIAAGAVLAGMLVLRRAFDGFKAAVTAAAEAQEAIIKVGNAFKTMGAYTTGAVDRATQFANSMQALTKYTDEEVLSTQALLAQLGRLTGAGLEEATKATLDLASGLGRELPVAALIMAKAAQGSTWELRKYGLVINENLPRTERWAKALRFVQEQFGGRAEEEIKGFNATLRQFGGAFKDVLAVIGAPVIIPLTKALQAASKAMLEFSSWGQRRMNQQLLGPDPSIQAALDKVRELESKLDRLAQKKLSPTRAFSSALRQEIADTTKELEEHQLALQRAINEYARLGPIEQAIEMQKRYVKAMQDARAAVAEAASSVKHQGPWARFWQSEMNALEKSAADATRVANQFSETLAQRFERSKQSAVDALQTISSEAIKATQPRDIRISVEGDMKLQAIEKQVREFVDNPKNWAAVMAQMKELPDLEVALNAVLATRDPEQIERFFTNLKESIERDAVDLNVNADPYSYAKVLKQIDFIRTYAGEKGSATMVMRVVMDQESVRQLRSGAKAFRQAFQFDTAEIQILDVEQMDMFGTINDGLKWMEDSFKRLKDLEPKDLVSGYSMLMDTLNAAIPQATAKSQIALRAYRTQAMQDYGAMARAAGDLVEENIAAKEAWAKVPSMKKLVGFAIEKQDWDAAADQIEAMATLIDIVPSEKRLELKGDIEDLMRKLKAAQLEAQKIEERISASKTIIRAAIDLGDWDAAIGEVEKLINMIESVPEEKRVAFKAEIDRAYIDIIKAEIGDQEKVLSLAVDVGNIAQAKQALLEMQKLAEELQGIDKIELDLRIKKLGIDIAKAELTTFQAEMLSSWQTTVSNLVALPWEAASAAAMTAFDAMLNHAVTVKEAMLNLFRDLVQQIIGIMVKLAIMDLWGVDKIIEKVGGAEKPTATTTQKLRFQPMPEVSFARVNIPLPILPEQQPPRWGKAAVGARTVDIKIDALDASSIRRQLETGTLGRELSRMMR